VSHVKQAAALARLCRDIQRDARHGVRTLLKSPGFALVTIAALAVGIGANLTIFGFVNALLLRPLPATTDPDRLVRADLGGPNAIENGVAYDDYVAYRDRNQTLSHLALFHPGALPPVRVTGRAAEVIHVMPVTGNYFETLGVHAAIGRTFSADDDRPGAGAVVLSHEGWTRHFGADPRIVGQTILISDVAFTVVGIAPERFEGTASPVIPRMYATWQALPLPPGLSPRGFMIGRLVPGATLHTAQADFARVAAQLRVETNQPVSVAVFAATSSMPGLQRVFSVFATLFMVIVGAVLWSACSNVAVLQLVRTNARRREMAIRLAIGATRLQLVRQLLIENLLLALVAGLVGVGLAVATARWLTQIQLPVPMPLGLPSFAVDWRVGVFAVAISVAASLVAGLGAALDARLTNASGVLRHEPGGASGPFSRQSLVISQVALTTVLLVVAVATTRSLVTPPDYGLNPNGVLLANVTLPREQYTAEEALPFFDRLVNAAESSAGVRSATLVETIPVAINRPLSVAEVDVNNSVASTDSRLTRPRVLVNHVSPGHFRTLGIRLAGGRDFRPEDDARSPRVVIVNETASRRFWPGESPLGKTLRLGSESATVIGVAGDSKYESIGEPAKAFLYRPVAHSPTALFEATLLIKTSGDPRRAIPLVRGIVAELDPTLALSNLNTLDDRLALAFLPNRAAAITAGLMGVIALGLGTLGTYSVMAFLVLQRRREVGIRIALGALPQSVVGTITRQGGRWIAIGLGLGLVVAMGAVRAIAGLVLGVSVSDPVPAGVVVLLLGSAGYLACYVPARRAGKADPVAVLRE
jgi:predicted permease